MSSKYTPSPYQHKISNLDNIPKMINAPSISYRCLNNMDWSMVCVDGFCNEILECSPDDLVSKKIIFGQLIDPDEAFQIWNVIQSALLKKTPFQISYHLITPKKHIKTVFEQGQGIYINGKVSELYGFISDITPYSNILAYTTIKDYFGRLTFELNELMKNKFGRNLDKLSNREIEIIIYLCKGMTMKEIGKKINISYRTVEMHINRIKWKLQCNCKGEIINLLSEIHVWKNILMIF
jgi:DNA-binding CsgD family transcriptional regulator